MSKEPQTTKRGKHNRYKEDEILLPQGWIVDGWTCCVRQLQQQGEPIVHYIANGKSPSEAYAEARKLIQYMYYDRAN